MTVSEAMSRLNEALKGFPKEVRESVLRHLEDEKKKDNVFSETDSELVFTSDQMVFYYRQDTFGFY